MCVPEQAAGGFGGTQVGATPIGDSERRRREGKMLVQVSFLMKGFESTTFSVENHGQLRAPSTTPGGVFEPSAGTVTTVVRTACLRGFCGQHAVFVWLKKSCRQTMSQYALRNQLCGPEQTVRVCILILKAQKQVVVMFWLKFSKIAVGSGFPRPVVDPSAVQSQTKGFRTLVLQGLPIATMSFKWFELLGFHA